MGFVVDLFPPSPETEAAAALGLAVAGRKGKGLFGRKPGETIEVLSRVILRLNTITWQAGSSTNRCLVYDPAALLSAGVRFGLETELPENQVPEANEEAYLAWISKWTKEAVSFKPQALDFPGLITSPDQVAPLLKGIGANAIEADLETKVQGAEIVSRLQEQLQGYAAALEFWTKINQDAGSLRDDLFKRLEAELEETKTAAEAGLKDLTAEIEAQTANKRQETDAAIGESKTRFAERREMLNAELVRFQESYQEKPDDHWRDQIKVMEKKILDIDGEQEKSRLQLEAGFGEFSRSQQTKINIFTSERDKRLQAIEQRRKRLDASLEGLAKAVEKRQAAYQSQAQVVEGITLELAPEKTDASCPLVFCAVRYSGDRWQVFAPQISGSRGLAGTLSGLVGGVNLPFKSASKLAEILADKLEKLVAAKDANDLSERLEEASQLKDPEFLALAKSGLSRLIDQGGLDKKHATLFNDL